MKLSSAMPHKKARIEIIPLIDIMFFLLASFMLVSLSMIKLTAIKTSLPQKSTAVNVPKPDFVAIGISADDHFYFDREAAAIPADQIPKRLAPYYAANQDALKVFVNADSQASYDAVITALDKVRSVGITKVSFPIKEGTHFDPLKPRPDTTSGILKKDGTPVVSPPAS
jgi:biopolymer transport protein ExbD